MKITITGSLGHISLPLTKELVQKGHEVKVISSNPDRKSAIEALGAQAAIGAIEDLDFLTKAFTGADAVYCMVPPNDYFNHDLNLMDFYHVAGNNYAKAISKSGVKRVVHLSSIGAHLEAGNGIIAGHHKIEETLASVPGIALTHMRPVYFYYNLFGYLNMIKNTGSIMANYGGSDLVAMVSPKDIAAAIADEITTDATGRKVRYVCSDEHTCDEIASIIGAAIGKPDLKWVTISDAQTIEGLKNIGMSPSIATGLVEMYASLHDGKLSEDYFRNRPKVLGKVKLEDFAKEFAVVYEG